jgi:(S)-mandelate dehydrogenase
MRVWNAGSIDDLREMARARLPRAVFDFMEGAADDELTLRWNCVDFDRVAWQPRVLVDVSNRNCGTAILGHHTSLPLIVAPTGLAALVWPQADAVLAQSAWAAGVPFTISTSSSVRMEAIREAAPEARLWFQAYPYKDRELVRGLITRAKAIGCEALVVTVDVPLLGRRLRDHRNRFTVPLRPTSRLVWDMLRCPRWTIQILHHGIPRMQNLVDWMGARTIASLAHLMTSNLDASVTWDSVAQLRDEWGAKLVLKGVLHPEDAERAARVGVDAIAVSNHGGRQLDGATSTIRALPQLVTAVSGRAEVYLDGGIRRGSDIAKACALGATAVMSGRALLYGAAAAGPAGAARAFEILAEEFDRCLALIGCPVVAQLDSSLLACLG